MKNTVYYLNWMLEGMNREFEKYDAECQENARCFSIECAGHRNEQATKIYNDRINELRAKAITNIKEDFGTMRERLETYCTTLPAAGSMDCVRALEATSEHFTEEDARITVKRLSDNYFTAAAAFATLQNKGFMQGAALRTVGTIGEELNQNEQIALRIAGNVTPDKARTYQETLYMDLKNSPFLKVCANMEGFLDGNIISDL